MSDAKNILDAYFPEMRWRCLSLAADLDRVQRGEGGQGVLTQDPRLRKLQQAIGVLQGPGPNRAEQVLMIFSDTSPPPAR
jgi:hypothetical protein